MRSGEQDGRSRDETGSGEMELRLTNRIDRIVGRLVALVVIVAELLFTATALHPARARLTQMIQGLRSRSSLVCARIGTVLLGPLNWLRRDTWSKIAALGSIGAIIIGLLSWLYPNEPAPPKTDSNYIYNSGLRIGHVQASSVANAVPVFTLNVEQSEKLNVGERIEFDGKRCIIYFLSGEKMNLVNEKTIFSYQSVSCRIL
jgi:hypothetical protein